VSALIFGSTGTIVIVHSAGVPDLLSSTDRTWPVTVEPPDLTVAVLPLNCAIRKRRTSFWSVVSNVNMKLSSVPANYRRLLLSMCENPEP
jgi:hypothetical protein